MSWRGHFVYFERFLIQTVPPTPFSLHFPGHEHFFWTVRGLM